MNTVNNIPTRILVCALKHAMVQSDNRVIEDVADIVSRNTYHFGEHELVEMVNAINYAREFYNLENDSLLTLRDHLMINADRLNYLRGR
jgi:hypothetical protein